MLNEEQAFAALKVSLADAALEFQVKLGYMDDGLSLFYPLDSLNRLMDAAWDQADMLAALNRFAQWIAPEWGLVTAQAEEDGRIRIRLSRQAVRLIHDTLPEPAFLKAFIQRLMTPGVTLEDIAQLCRQFSPQVAVERLVGGEFDALIYFPLGDVDTYRYCLKFDMGLATYHRFTKADYEALGLTGA